MNSARQSNIELLRIIATLFIVIVHCNGWFLEQGGVKLVGNETVTDIWRVLVQSVTIIGVDLFVLISGYFSIRPKVKSIVNLFTILVFFYVGCYLLNCFLGNQLFSYRTLLKNCFAFSRENWFIQCYLFLMLLSPLVNVYMQNISKNGASIFFAIFILSAFWFGDVRQSEYFYFNGGYSVTSLLLIYVVGRYIRLYGEEFLKRYSSKMILLAWLICTFVIGIIMYYFPEESNRFLTYCSPIILLSASLFFVLFARISFQSKVVNWIGSSCLAVFILHTCDPVIDWLVEIDNELFAGSSLFKWILLMSGVIIVVFVGAILLDKIREFIFRPVIKWAGNLSILGND